MSDPLTDPEDVKLHTLAKGARARIGAAQGAAVRDETGRTYASASIALPSLTLSALAAAVAQAAAAGARSLEAAVLVASNADISDADITVVRDLAGTGTPLYLCGSDPVITAQVTT